MIIASDDTLKTNPELVKKFLAATEKGYQYAIENPETGAAILQRYAPDYPLEMLEISQNYLADKYMEDADRWGVMKDEVWDRYTEFMMEYGVIDKLYPCIRLLYERISSGIKKGLEPMVKLEVSGLSFPYDNKKLFENLDFLLKKENLSACWDHPAVESPQS